MNEVEYFRQLARHDEWANRALLGSLRNMPNPPQRALDVFAHIFGTEWTWLSRMHGSDAPMKVWPAIKLDECEQEQAKLRKAWDELLAKVPLESTYKYANTKGERFESSVRDTLTHVFLHGHYHRGQVVLMIRQAGLQPPYIDFIESVRKGYLGH